MAKRRKGISGKPISSPLVLATLHPYDTRSGRAIRSALILPQQHDAPLLELLELLVENNSLDVLSLLCLGSCSKACRSAAASLLVNGAHFLLPNTVKLAAKKAAYRYSYSEHVQAVTWLLQGAASARVFGTFLAAPGAAAQYLITKMPLELAEQLLKAGLRFSYDQLMQAVRAHTAGVEVWVQAMAAQPAAVKTALQVGLPPWVQKLCCQPAMLVSAPCCLWWHPQHFQ
jgi:hypothetical protein